MKLNIASIPKCLSFTLALGASFLNSDRVNASDQVIKLLCDLPYGYRYAPISFQKDKLFEILGSHQKELCASVYSFIEFENGRLICIDATITQAAINRSDIELAAHEWNDCNTSRPGYISLKELECMGDVSDFTDIAASTLRVTDTSVAQWYHSYVQKIEIDFVFQTVASETYGISTAERKSEKFLVSAVRNGTINKSALYVSVHKSDSKGQKCD